MSQRQPASDRRHAAALRSCDCLAALAAIHTAARGNLSTRLTRHGSHGFSGDPASLFAPDAQPSKAA